MRPVRLKTYPPPQPLPAGTRLDRFELRGVLGSGPFGITYRALDLESDDDVVIKEYMPPSMAWRSGATQVVPHDDSTRETFLSGLRFFINEGQLLPRFEHPALVKVLGCWEANGTAYLAMPLLVGRDMQQTFQSRPKPPREVTLRAMLDTLLGAIETLHRAKVEHRDLSPRTIMILAQGQPVVMDMHSPRRVTAARGDTGPTGPRSGYAPIEMYGSGQGHERGPWTDIYSLGATMYFLAGGKAPPPAQQRQPDDRIALALVRHDLRHSLDFLAVIDWMLAPDPKDRPQSVAQLRAALASGELPARFAPPRRVRLGARLRHHRRWLIGAALAVGLAGVAGGGYTLHRQGRLPWQGSGR